MTTRDLGTIGYYSIGIVVTLDDGDYGATSDYTETFTLLENITSPCDYALIQQFESNGTIPRLDFFVGGEAP